MNSNPQRFVIPISSLAIAGLATTSAHAGGIEPYWHFSGVFHPAVAHFPIGLLTVAGAIELFRIFKPRKDGKVIGDASFVCIVLGTLAALVTTTLGWANSAAAGEFNGTLKDVEALHRWLGVAVCGVGVIATVLATLARRRQTASAKFRWSLRGATLAGAALVGLVGSFGGKLTHGNDYYKDAYDDLVAAVAAQENTEPANDANANQLASQNPIQPTTDGNDTNKQTLDNNTNSNTTGDTNSTTTGNQASTGNQAASSQTISFQRDIHPIFTNYCVKCHSEDKKKGGYRLDTKTLAFTAGDSEEPPIVPGKSDESLLVKVIEGGPGFEDDMMPPKGSVLSKSEVALVRKWIDEGAEWDMPTPTVGAE